MNEDLERASREAIDAARNSDQLQLILAVLQAQQITQAMQQPTCQHHQAPAPQQSANVGKWLAIAAGGSLFLLAFAVSMVAFAIGAVSVAVVALVLRGIWADIQRDKARDRKR
ncbi:hypothetical protein [Streptomyces sp. NPDC002758]